MEYWKHERKLDIDQTKPIYDLSRHISSKLKMSDKNFRQTVEIAITEFIIENNLRFQEHVPFVAGDKHEPVVDSGEIAK